MERDRPKYQPLDIDPEEQMVLESALRDLGGEGFGERPDEPEEEMAE